MKNVNFFNYPCDSVTKSSVESHTKNSRKKRVKKTIKYKIKIKNGTWEESSPFYIKSPCFYVGYFLGILQNVYTYVEPLHFHLKNNQYNMKTTSHQLF